MAGRVLATGCFADGSNVQRIGGRLARAEIHQAYKRAANIMHPDGGGDAQSFCELAAARDALMKPGRTSGG